MQRSCSRLPLVIDVPGDQVVSLCVCVCVTTIGLLIKSLQEAEEDEDEGPASCRSPVYWGV